MCVSGDIHEYADPEPKLFRKVEPKKAPWLTVELIVVLKLLRETHAWGLRAGKTIPSICRTLSQRLSWSDLILTDVLGGRQDYYTHFADRKTKAQRNEVT